jgi:multiphosphoryl transfer protein
MPHGANTSLDFEFFCSLSAGLHARPASHLAEVANDFVAESTLINHRTGAHASLKSVLAIISADVRAGDHCSVQVGGADEHAAHVALRGFIEQVLPSCDVPLAGITPAGHIGKVPRVLERAGVECKFGVPVSQGIARGKVVLMDAMALPFEPWTQAKSDPEWDRTQVLNAVVAVCNRIRQKLAGPMSSEERAVLQAELAMASDVSLTHKFSEQVTRGKSAGQAVIETGRFFISLLRRSDSEYMRARALDVEEICRQILDEIYQVEARSGTLELREPSVVVVETLAPQQLLALNRRWLQGLVLEHSGTTSHALILARSLGIPALVGVKDAQSSLPIGQEVIMDANRGLITAPVTPLLERFYEREQKTLERRQELLPHNASARVATTDGSTLEIAANASSLEESSLAFENGADGIGLFRTEMAFLQSRSSLSEEEQFSAYAQVVRAAGEKPVIFRTLDLGGDKAPAYLNLSGENNPFLGYRGVRIYAEFEDLLQAHLCAILRASTFGRVQIMAPMISSAEEVIHFKAAVAKARQELAVRGCAVAQNVPIGIMIEVPSAAFILHELCAEVDFFSIGTNDLSQYFFAADRNNPKIARLSNVQHPGFIRFLKKIVDEIKGAGKWVGVCGEMAAENRYLSLFVGLGVDEISIPAPQIRLAKHQIMQLSSSRCKELLAQVEACGDSSQVDDLLEHAEPSLSTESLLTEQLVLTGRDIRNKEEAIQELINSFYIIGRIQDRQRLEDALWAREELYSTGLGFGFATPHCKTDAVSADSIGILKLDKPIDWNSVDGKPVEMILLIAMRETQCVDTHMKVFSRLARKLMDDEFRQVLLALDSACDIVSYMAHELDTPKSGRTCRSF